MARKKTKRGTRKASPFARQVIDEAALRFGPEQDALVGLVGTARKTARDRQTGVEAGTRGLNAAIDSRSALAAAAAAAHQHVSDQIAARAHNNTQGLGPNSDPFKAIIESELAGSASRSAESDKRLQGELGAQRTSAARYQASQTDQIGSDLDTNLKAIGDRLRSLKRESGTFAAARLGELQGDQRERRFELRKIREQQQGDLDKALKLADVDQDNALELEKVKAKDDRANTRLDNRLGGGKNGKGSKPTTGLGSLTRNEENAQVDKISGARRWIERLKSAGADDHTIRQLVASGGSVPYTQDGKQKSLKVPAFGDDFANAGFDIVAHGHITRPNVNRLHSRGIHIPSKWRKGRNYSNPPLRKPPYQGR